MDMWQSQDDIVKDLASLNDFSTPGDKEPYKVLYSIGRGSKFKERLLSSEKFYDPRTGEAIDTEDEVLDNNDYWCKGRGRGSLLGGFSRSKFQLQQQLRLARPLGSGDEAIESYCRSKQLCGKSQTSTGSLESESNKGGQPNSEILNINLNSDKVKQRIKAIRNSSTGSNALITGLLTKYKENSEIKLTNKEGNFVSNINEENLTKTFNDNVSCNDKDYTIQTDCIEFSTARSSPNCLNDEDELLTEKCNGENSYLKEICSSPGKTQTLEKAGQNPIEGLNHDREEEERPNKGSSVMEESKCESERIFFECTEQEHDRNGKYRMLGERLERLRKIDPKISDNGMYDFSEISRCIAPITVDSNGGSLAVTASSHFPEYFILKDDDFPPLRNESLKSVN